MSGGYWDGRNREIGWRIIEELTTKVTTILKAADEALIAVDYALSGDDSKEDAKEKLFEIFKKLGDDLYEK